MARKRKPLIEPGSILPTQETMLERIVERDRVVSGRQQLEVEKIDPVGITIKNSQEIENIASNTASNIASNTASNIASNTASNIDLEITNSNQQANRLVTITLRLPEELNDWLDDYAHANRKLGTTKQELVASAVQLLKMRLTSQ